MSAPAQVTESKSPAFRNVVEPLGILLTDVSGNGVCGRILKMRSRDAILEPVTLRERQLLLRGLYR